MIHGGAAHLKAHTEEINNLNVFPVPDGDTGDNMLSTVNSGVNSMNKCESSDVGETAAALSRGMLLGARGNSGVILSQYFSGIAKSLEGKVTATASALAEALISGVKQAYRAVASPVEGTILTVAREGVEKSVEKVDSDTTVESLIVGLTNEMSSSLSRTPEKLPILKEAGVIDSGGAGLFYIFEGMANVLTGKQDDSTFDVHEQSTSPSDFGSFDKDSEMTYGYCTEFLLQLQSSKVDVDSFDVALITEYLKTVGDSIVSFKEGSIVKVHVHTMTPESVLGFCRRYGEFLTIKIENMSVQHSEKIVENALGSKKAEEKEYGSVVVCSGGGIRETFISLAADEIIDGGQTNNPSTEDFLDAFAKINAKHIFVFPNNSNIILAARQAAEIYTESDVRVIESKNLGAGYVGVSVISPEYDNADELEEAINDAIKDVVTGQVSPAVRTTDICGIHIENGDHICFVGKKMIASRKTRAEAARALADDLLGNGEKYILTVFFGSDADENDRADFVGYIEEQYPSIELYEIDGGQAVYSHILVTE